MVVWFAQWERSIRIKNKHLRRGIKMSPKLHLAVISVVCAVNISPFTTGQLFAREQADEPIEEIIVTGTRRLNRTVANSPVPVDVFQAEELQNMGTSDMDDVLRTLIPSYNVERHTLEDEAALIRPATLRGLPPDNTLILINGKRHHRAAVITGRGGSQGPDISAIPAIALARVEVLRDGASAQYGSDAIAGVINWIMLENNDGIVAEYKTGQFYAGDGTVHQFGINVGMPLTDSGFLSLSLEYAETDSTSRSEQRFDARALEDLGAPGIPNPAQNYGQPSISGEARFFANAAFDVGSNSEIYAFGNYATRNLRTEFFWRNPNSLTNIFTVGPDRLVFDLTADGSGNCPTAGTPGAIPHPNFFFPTQAEYDADLINLAALAADPDCWTVNEIYPAGYRPDYGAEIVDYSFFTGLRGEIASGFRYDFSASYGVNDISYQLSNTINASLGPSSPTSFRPGGNVQSEKNLNIDVAWPINIAVFYSPLTIAAGFEWREEQYETQAGDDASWTAGPLHLQGASIGSHGFPGFPPEQAGSWDRANTAVYLDLEADVTERLLLGFAVRFEEFDDFGSTTNIKGAFRYEFNDAFAVRASASTGFRAPTPGQSNVTRTRTEGFNGMLLQGGLIPPTNPIAEFFGGKALTPEESENLSFGFSLEPLDNLTITADYFRINVDDKIALGEQFALTSADIADLVALGVPGASDFVFVTFFGNSSRTETDGFDLVATYNIEWQSAGNTNVTLAWNQTNTEVKFTEVLSRRSIIDLENRPADRGILTINHSIHDWRFQIRGSYYGGWVRGERGIEDAIPVCTDIRPNPPGTDECYGDEFVVDIETAYTFNDRFRLIVGADNVFDTFPEFEYDFPDRSFGLKYPRRSPIGYHGGYWYVRLRGEFY